MVGRNVTVVQDRVEATIRGLNALADTRVMVGIPSTRAAREDSADDDINNAALGYIHENGAPEVGIPARPWLVPGVQQSQAQTIKGLERAAENALAGRAQAAQASLNAVGLRAVSSVRAYLTAGVSPPLKDDTIRNRHRSRGTQTMRPGEIKELANRGKGIAPSVDLVKPLINTGQMRNAVTYVIRKVPRA